MGTKYHYKCHRCLSEIEDEQVTEINGKMYCYIPYCLRCDTRKDRKKQTERMLKRMDDPNYQYNDVDFFIEMLITDEEIEKARKMAVIRREHCRKVGKVSKFDTADPIRTEMTGILGELKMRQLLEREFIDYQNNYDQLLDGHDGGYDFLIYGKKFDLKTREVRKEVTLLDTCYSTITRHKIDPDVHVFAFINYDNKSINFVGFLDHARFVEFSDIVKQGTGYTYYDAHIIKVSGLIPMRYLENNLKSISNGIE